MAIKHYKFNPKLSKNSSTQKIKKIIELYGMKLGDEPILEHLRKAAEDQVSSEILSTLPLS